MPGWSPNAIRELATSLGVWSAERAETPPEATAVRDALAELAGWAAGRRRVAVVVPDATRALPAGIVAELLASLAEDAGRQVTVVVATGLHRPPTSGEWRSVDHLTEVTRAGCAVRDAGGLADPLIVDRVGDVDVAFDRAVVEADGIVVCGAVELHQYAGFSGGIKAVAVGCASAETIGWIHRPALLRDPKLGVGLVEGNPFREQLTRLVRHLPPMFEVQVSCDRDGRWRLFAGPAPQGWERAVAASSVFSDVPVAEAAIVGVFGAKGANLYQASRGPTQLVLQARPPLVEQAPVVLVTEAPHGIGDGAGERAFAAALKEGRDVLLEELATFDDRVRTGGGTQRAYIVALTSARHPVAYVALEEAEPLTAFGWPYLRSEADVRAFLGRSDSDDILRVPDPLHHLPRRAA